MSIAAYIDGIGFLGPGFSDWPQASEVLAGRRPYEPAPAVLPASSLLPPTERRRVGRVVKLALTVASEAAAHAGVEPAALKSVFSSSGGDGHNCHEICRALAEESREISPTRFANSVHNAAAGYWSIATGATPASTVLCAYDASFGAGLLEALAQVTVDQEPLLLIAYDTEYPEPLNSKRPIPDAFGVSFVLVPRRTPGSLARIEATLGGRFDRVSDGPSVGDTAPSIPAARSLPLLRRIALGESGIRDARVSRRVEYRRAGRPMRLNRDWIEAHIPHQGRMCLLDEVIEWSPERIRCRIGGHRAADHPLRSHGRLGISCGIELAAQAMAVHGALIADASRGKTPGRPPRQRRRRAHARRCGSMMCKRT